MLFLPLEDVVAEWHDRSHHSRVACLCPPPPVVSFQGVIADLKLRGDPRAAERQCEEEEDDAEVSAGSTAGAGSGPPPPCSQLGPHPFSTGKHRSLGILAAAWKVASSPQGRSR